MSKYTLEIRITEEHEETGEVFVCTVTHSSNREDWLWMLLPVVNAINGAGFLVDPLEVTYKGRDCVELSVDSLASIKPFIN